MKKNYMRLALLLNFYLVMIHSGFAQVPVNDDCAGAITVTVAVDSASCVTTVSENTLNATTATYTSLCWSVSYDDDIWYSFVPGANTVNINISNLSNNPSTNYIGLSVFDACGGIEIFCSASAIGGGSTVIGGLTAGSTYYISMFYADVIERGTFDFCLYDVTNVPANDNCAGAINIAVAPDLASCVPTTANTLLATGANYISNCWSVSYDDDLWYQFTATTDTMFLYFSNLSVPGAPAIGYALFEGACSAAEFFCGESDFNDTILAGLTPGTTYYLSAFYLGTSDRGTFDICVVSNSTVGISQIDDINKTLNIYPNPSTDHLSLKFKTNKVSDLTVKITDLQGKDVYNNVSSDFSGEFNKNIDVKTLGKGLYFLKIISDNNIITRKVVIQ